MEPLLWCVGDALDTPTETASIDPSKQNHSALWNRSVRILDSAFFELIGWHATPLTLGDEQT
jgi:hypothetical protein